MGPTGLAGSHALEALRDVPGVRVRGVCHLRPPSIEAGNIDYVQANLLEPGAGLERLMEGIDYVLLFAGVVATTPVLARDPVGPVIQNLLMTTHALKASYDAGVKKVIWLSSTTGYPEGGEVLNEDDMMAGDPPDKWYGMGWMTRYLETQARLYSSHLEPRMSVIALRPSLMYGPYDNFSFEEGHFLPALIRRVVERHDPIEIWGDGKDRRDLVHAQDVVDAALLSLAKLEGFHAINIAGGRDYSVNDILTRLLELDDFTGANVRHVGATKPGAPRSRRFSVEKAHRLLGFEPSVSLDEGLSRTLEWWRAASQRAAGPAAVAAHAG